MKFPIMLFGFFKHSYLANMFVPREVRLKRYWYASISQRSLVSQAHHGAKCIIKNVLCILVIVSEHNEGGLVFFLFFSKSNICVYVNMTL